MEQVKLWREGHVAHVRMVHGGNNAIGRLMVEELARSLVEVRADPEVHAVVLTSGAEKFFSIGLDLPELFPLGRDELADFVRAFDGMCMDLYALPKPTVAAISGHATAGGAVLALCCDRRVMGAGKRVMGLNEIKLGIPVPFHADRVLRDLVDGRVARALLEGGEFRQPDELKALGLVDDVVPPERVLEEALSQATALAAHPREGFAATKRNRTGPVLASVLADLEAKQREFVDLWFSEEARGKLREAMARF